MYTCTRGARLHREETATRQQEHRFDALGHNAEQVGKNSKGHLLLRECVVCKDKKVTAKNGGFKRMGWKCCKRGMALCADGCFEDYHKQHNVCRP